jgi:hypothetical protein
VDIHNRVNELVAHLAEVILVLPGEVLQRPALVELADDALGTERRPVSVEPPGRRNSYRAGGLGKGLKELPLAAAVTDEDTGRRVTSQHETLVRAARPLDLRDRGIPAVATGHRRHRSHHGLPARFDRIQEAL